MGLAIKVRMLLAARNMTLTDLAERMEPKTTRQTISKKLSRDNLTEDDLNRIAKACDATFEGCFTLNDTGKIL